MHGHELRRLAGDFNAQAGEGLRRAPPRRAPNYGAGHSARCRGLAVRCPEKRSNRGTTQVGLTGFRLGCVGSAGRDDTARRPAGCRPPPDLPRDFSAARRQARAGMSCPAIAPARPPGYFQQVHRMTKQEQLVVAAILGLLLVGWAVKVYRTAHPPEPAMTSVRN